MTTWYAVLKNPDDDWDNGSYDKAEAIEMLREQGYGEIAVIDEEENYCDESWGFDEVFPDESDDEDGIWEVYPK